MSDTPDPSDGSTDRRTFLGFVGAAAAGVSLPLTAESRAQEADQYVVEQGDTCIPVVPLGSDQSVEEFYDYRTPHTDPSGRTYSSYGTTDLQRNDTSLLFLHEGPDGVSLVMVHDRLVDASDGSDGGSVTFEFAGLPSDGEWVVKDDDYDAPSNYDVWQRDGDTSTIDWTWAADRSDGGAFRGLTEDSEITLTPRFNEEATLHGEYYDGTISEWQLLSGDAEDPERTTLAMDEPITVRAGSCGTSAEAEVEVDVDVRPGGNPVVNPRSSGRLPVAVTSTAEFDATTIDPASIRFGPADAEPTRSITRDVTGDGRADLVLLFNTQALGVTTNTETLVMTGTTADGETNVRGSADIRIVPPGDGDDRSEERDDRSKEREDREDDREEREEKREEAREKAEEKREKAEEKREKAEEKREEARERREERRDDDDDDDDDREGRGRRDDDEDDEDDDDDDDDEDDDDDDDSLGGGFGISISLG